MAQIKDLINIIFPDVKTNIQSLENKYPKRKLSTGAEVTRFAPSPTGFLHTGSLFTSLIAKTIARQSHGIFYTRLEDTDSKREISGSGDELIKQLAVFGVLPDEGFLADNKETGLYGPYIQSKRADIYRVIIKYLMEIGRAYPCFCTSEEIELIRKEQESYKQMPGYYGQYARCRNLSVDEQIERIQRGEKFVIRFRSMGNHFNKIKVHDEIRGDIEIADNDLDIVILKSDGLPTYHFAHVVDDHFMRTTLVNRGEEWISSLPIHIELFKALNWEAPKYAHLPVIMKLDNGNKRKLSKRKDPEAAVSYFIENGYPPIAVINYLMSIANSNYEEWTIKNKSYEYQKFHFDLQNMSLDGALYDIDKLSYFSKGVIAHFSSKELTFFVKTWSSVYDHKLYSLIAHDEKYFEQIMNIEREKENPRKDYAKYSDIYPLIRFFYSDYYEMIAKNHPYNELISRKVISQVLKSIIVENDYSLDEESWFESLKNISLKNGFAVSNKEYKLNKDKFLGHVGDVAEILRISLCASKNSPNLYQVMQILGKFEVDKRLEYVIDNFLK